MVNASSVLRKSSNVGLRKDLQKTKSVIAYWALSSSVALSLFSNDYIIVELHHFIVKNAIKSHHNDKSVDCTS